MHILITGTTGYIGKRLIFALLEMGHHLYCCVRDLQRVPDELEHQPNITFLKADFLDPADISFPEQIEVAYYLIHSMSSQGMDFSKLEQRCAQNFRHLLEKTNCRQVIYLGGIANDHTLSRHLQSRLEVENILRSPAYSLTVFRAGIIVGSGSASFEIIRDIVEKLPIMICPKWLNTRTQPIAVRDVLSFLRKAAGNSAVMNGTYDICGPEILTYKQLLLQFAELRNLRRTILTLPVLTPRLSSYWLYFVTSTSFNLAKALVDSMKVEVIARESNINSLLEVEPVCYRKAVSLAFQKIEQNAIVSSWKDALSSGIFQEQLANLIQIPDHGCFKDVRARPVVDEEATLRRIWSIGGNQGWYGSNTLWRLRGLLDKMFGGVGLRRGRTHPTQLESGDPLDFWRVLLADKNQKRLLLFAEMKLPGEAWLEFKIDKKTLYQRAVFRPRGVWGRLYWYAVLPFHAIVFRNMIRSLAR